MAPGGEKILAIGESPTVILHAGKFHATGFRIFNDSEHFLELVNIAAMNDEIQRDADAIAFEPLEDAQLVLMRLGAGDVVGSVFARALKTELEMIEAGIYKKIQLDFVERKAGSDEASIESGSTSIADKRNNVGTRQRFAPGEISLKNAGFRGFFEDTRPVFGGKFVRTGLQFERIRTVDAVKRAAVCKFSNKG